MKLIKVKYLHDGVPKGRAYTFIDPIDVKVGDRVLIGTGSYGIVTEIGVFEEEVAAIKDKLKAIAGKAEEEEKDGNDTDCDEE